MKNGLNILHYCIYKGYVKLNLLLDKINPFNLIHKLPFQKRRYEKLGIDIQKEINIAFGNKEFGISVMVAGGAILGILFFLLMAVANILIRIMNLNITLTINYFIIFSLISLIICYFLVFKKDKYLEYFKKYERWTKAEKMKYGWISFCFVVMVSIFFIGSFML